MAAREALGNAWVILAIALLIANGSTTSGQAGQQGKVRRARCRLRNVSSLPSELLSKKHFISAVAKTRELILSCGVQKLIVWRDRLVWPVGVGLDQRVIFKSQRQQVVIHIQDGHHGDEPLQAMHEKHPRGVAGMSTLCNRVQPEGPCLLVP